MQKRFLSTRKLATIALLLALHIVVTRFIAVETQIFRISFSFVPTSLCAMLFGPWIGAIFGFVADLLGMLVFPKGPYFPGFGLNEALYALTYGLFLFNKKKDFRHIFPCLILQTIIIDLGLSTLWLHLLYGNPIMLILSSRIVSAIVMLPVKYFGIKYTWKFVGSRFLKKK
ncbi:MAG: folate family ECF transporter S component [Clostridia bacterium]|nr:folate family ECF transporter S component [Clostridia bacterium]